MINSAAVIVVIAFMYYAKSLLIPVILSVFLFYLLDPIAEFFYRKVRIPRAWSSPVLIVASLATLAGMGLAGYVVASDIASQLPNYQNKIHKMTSSAQQHIEALVNKTSAMVQLAEPSVDASKDQTKKVQKVEVVNQSNYMSLTGIVLKGLDSIFGVVGIAFIVALLTSLILIDKNNIADRVSSLRQNTLNPNSINYSTINQSLSGIVQRFFVGNMVAGIGSSVLFFLLFFMMGLENKSAIAIGAGFLNVVPVIGPFLSVIFPFGQGLLQYESIGPFLSIFGASVVIHFIFGNLVLPKLMSKTLDLNMIATTLGLVCWGCLWGPIGIFLAIPLTAILRIIFSQREETLFLACLMKELPAKPRAILVVKSLKVSSLLQEAQRQLKLKF